MGTSAFPPGMSPHDTLTVESITVFLPLLLSGAREDAQSYASARFTKGGDLSTYDENAIDDRTVGVTK